MTKTDEIMKLVYQLERAVKDNNCDFSNEEDHERHTDAREVLKAAIEKLVADAESIRAAERERCAKVIENGHFLHDQSPAKLFADQAAKAIRSLE